MATCEKCGHINPEPSNITAINGWQQQLHAKLAADIEATKSERFYTGLVKQDGKWVRDEYVTLILSKFVRTRLVDMVNGATEPSPLEVFEAFVVPVIEKLDDMGVKIVGHLALPSKIDLAYTDLTHPWAVFCLLTVKNAVNMREMLKAVGLDALLNEGVINTIGGDENWFGRVPERQKVTMPHPGPGETRSDG